MHFLQIQIKIMFDFNQIPDVDYQSPHESLENTRDLFSELMFVWLLAGCLTAAGRYRTEAGQSPSPREMRVNTSGTSHSELK